ncbi:hypothetical protein B0J14DRAFT_667436 [Halenospora varia]|nr:hypothetical protein B0J14DRAFT_667436 [Halenospora varia]
MIDTKVHRAMHGFKDGDDYCDFESLEEELGRNGGEFSDKNILICDHKIHGFSLTMKTWHMLKVELREEIDFNLEAFESLLLPQHQKEMIHSLVKVHSSDGIGFDDLIKEDIADYTKIPLYTSCGELGIDSDGIEKNLKEALDLATTWNAIILIDEADIFLEARGPRELRRNSLVSIFLRSLEYYQGILILTTNGVDVFDSAIKSMIHLAIKYQTLPEKSRSDLWRTFIKKASPGTDLQWLTEEILDRLALENLNGGRSRMLSGLHTLCQ